jgi:hypothetical protein
MKELATRSPLTKQAIEIQKDFYNGEGWTQNGDLVINDDGWTVTDLLNFICDDYSTFNGFSIALNFDGRGLISEMVYLPFEYVRFGVPNEMGKHSEVAVSNNWEEQPHKLPQGTPKKILRFPLFNPDMAQSEVLTGEGGQIFYFTGKPDMYPLASLDAVADSTQADAEIQRFELNNAANGFHGATILKTVGEFEDEHEESKFNKKVNETLGSSSPGILTVQMDYEEMGANLFEGIPADNKDKLFETTFRHIDRRIMQNYKQPPALRGVSPEGAVFNQQEIADSFVYYNSATKNQRSILSRAFNRLGQLWSEGPKVFGEIVEQEFQKPVFEQRVLPPDQDIDPPTDNPNDADEPDNLVNIYGKRYGSG